ncbi:CinA family nicotinamide mononucleotide deamidase-related protein [Yinghuangia soli]|uniref:CinA-like protein n=1 Tax=Yinghuangia soli TaxID=2908204 RepID=A0AA41Q731_9ACTN|nr:CinA family nicotinamide mononucleotide deamidase-related protein [Yinghuangia soli]MCF2532804.1 CinA family nicotinamide mononucleotide deamidase-related protein [Yinghuangia soli]
MKVELVAVGDELLIGDVVNTNATRLGRLLTDAGMRVTGISTVGDGLDELVDVLRIAVGRADAVLITGGLGPTSDDRTREAVARVAGVALRRDPEVEQWLRDRYKDTGRTLTALGLQQADVPEGGRMLPNGRGSAPGLAVDVRGSVVYATPGVPHEMAAMVAEQVLPDMLRRAGSPAPRAQRVLRTVGVGEGIIAAYLEPLEKELAQAGAVEVAYLAEPGETRVKLTSAGPGGGAAVDAAALRAYELLGDCVYAEGTEQLAAVVARLLAERGATLAAAESLTGGQLAATLVGVPGVSAVFRGSVTAYATDVKQSVLGVDAALLAAEGAVHPGVAREMAAGVRSLLSGTYGVATTGVAGPDPQDGHPVGEVYIAVAGPDGDAVAALALPGDRDRIRTLAVVRSLELLRRTLLGLPQEHTREFTG